MAGIPVLSSPLDAVIDVIKTHHVGKILPSLAPTAIASAINAMVADLTDLAACTITHWTYANTNSTGKRRVFIFFVFTMMY